MIPKTIIQLSKDQKLPQYVLNKLKSFTGDHWTYIHFTDDEIIEYLQINAVEEFPFIAEQFVKITSGPHKSDLFRYYYLYKNGGVYIDSDAVPISNINYLVENYDFFTVNSITAGSCFQGFIGSCSGHNIVKQALDHACSIDATLITKHYGIFTEQLDKIIQESDKTKIKLLYEALSDLQIGNNKFIQTAITYDLENLNAILIHYFRTKIIPKENVIHQVRAGDQNSMRPGAAIINNLSGEPYLIECQFDVTNNIKI